MLVATLFFSTSVAYADEAPTPPKDAKELQCLVGQWQGKGTITVGSMKVKIAGNHKCETTAEGCGVACKGTMTGIPGMATYEFQDLWGVDPGDGAVHWYVVTNAGETHDHKGKIAKNEFKAKYVGKRDGKKFVEKVSFAFANKNKIRARSDGYVAGKLSESLDLTMEKTSARSARR